MPLPWLLNLAVGIGLQIVGYMLLPKPKTDPPPSTSDLEEPTSESGRPIPLLMGSMKISAPNLIGAWDKQSVHRKADTGSKK